MELRPIVVIPARGGSKRIARKNLLPLSGKPILGHVIDNCLASGLFSQVVVSTDDSEIANVATSFGASVPFIRSKSLADDLTPTLPVIQDAILRVCDPEEAGERIIACMYPTAPLIGRELFIAALERLREVPPNSFVFAATRNSTSAWQALTLDPSGRACPLFPERTHARTQDLPDTFEDVGAFYFAQGSTWLDARSMWDHSFAVEVPRTLAWDLDDETDLQVLRAFASLQSIDSSSSSVASKSASGKMHG